MTRNRIILFFTLLALSSTLPLSSQSIERRWYINHYWQHSPVDAAKESDTTFVVVTSYEPWLVQGASVWTYVTNYSLRGDSLWTTRISDWYRTEPVGLIKDKGWKVVGNSHVSTGTDSVAIIWMVQLGTDGKVVRKTELPESRGKRAKLVQELANGDFLILANDSILMKYSSDNQHLWSKTIPNERRIIIRKIEPAGDDIFLAGTQVRWNESVGSTTEVNPFVIKLDSNGEVIWRREYRYEADESATSLLVLPDRTMILYGHEQVDSNFVYRRSMIRHLDHDGTELSELSRDSSEAPTAIFLRSNGDLLAVFNTYHYYPNLVGTYSIGSTTTYISRILNNQIIRDEFPDLPVFHDYTIYLELDATTFILIGLEYDHETGVTTSGPKCIGSALAMKSGTLGVEDRNKKWWEMNLW